MPLESIETDSDLPSQLNTASKQETLAKSLAAAHTGKKVRGVQAPSIQGCYSRTRIVKLVGGEKLVIQFRVQPPLEIECFTKARAVLGDVVPDVAQIRDEELEALGIMVYALSYVPGDCWLHIPASDREKRTRIAASLGRILGRGFVEDNSTDVVESYILPTLHRLRDGLTSFTESLRPMLATMIAAAPRLKSLPLYISHHDLNEMNVLVSRDSGEVTGIVDWEFSRSLPFGMGLHRVTDTIVAECFQRQLRIPEGSADAEKVFWDAVLERAPRAVLDRLEDVQMALTIGALIFAFVEVDGRILRLDETPKSFLMGVLSYRLPQLRGEGALLLRSTCRRRYSHHMAPASLLRHLKSSNPFCNPCSLLSV